MKLTVEVEGHLVRIVGQERFELDAPEGANLVQLIYHLNDHYGNKGMWKVFNPRHEGILQMTILYNGAEVGDPADVDVVLGEGDTVRFIPPPSPHR